MAASMLTAVYCMLKRSEPSKELGVQYCNRRDKARTTARLIRRFQAQLVNQSA